MTAVRNAAGDVVYDDPDPVHVTTALARVMAELPGMPKAEYAPANMGGYAYRGIETMTRTIQPLLAKHGVVIVPHATITGIEPSPGQKEAWQDVYLRVEWMIHGPDGSHITACTTGIGRDHTDKGTAKAQTAAFKYLLLQMFCVADAVDDADGHDYTEPEPEEPYGYRVFRHVKEVSAKERRLPPLLRQFALDHGKSLTADALRDDEAWAALVERAVDEHIAASFIETRAADAPDTTPQGDPT